MRNIAFRVDVDTLSGSLNGVPQLLSIFDKYNVRASFYFSFGPDNSGKAIRRIFRKGFISKMYRTNAIKLYGLKTMMYGLLLPAPTIWKKAIRQMRSVMDAGHEVAIHSWDHVQYHDLLDEKSEDCLKKWFDLAHSAFFTVFGHFSTGSASPAWRCNDITLKLQENYALEYASDCRGYKPFYPIVEDRILKTLQIPTTMPTMDELLANKLSDCVEIREYLLQRITSNYWNVYTLHAEVEGNAYLRSFELFLQDIIKESINIHTLLDIARRWKSECYLASKIERCEVSGRSGWVSFADC